MIRTWWGETRACAPASIRPPARGNATGRHSFRVARSTWTVPFSDFHNTVLAITGGTGKYRNARGQMVLKSRDNGAKYDFIYQLLP